MNGIKASSAIVKSLIMSVLFLLSTSFIGCMGSDSEMVEVPVSSDLTDMINDLKANDNYSVKTVKTTSTMFKHKTVDPEKTLYIAIGMERKYTDKEISAIQKFVREGGHAIIAADGGHIGSLAERFNITYYSGTFYDTNYDRNGIFPVCDAVLGVDLGQWVYDENAEPNRAGQKKVWDGDNKDCFWDDDDDKDGLVDEDETDRIDNDQDNRKLSKRELRDNDYDGKVDESDEGIDEDSSDDDGDWVDEYPYNNIQDPYEIGVNEERLNKINDDEKVYLFTLELNTINPGNIPSALQDRFARSGIELPGNAQVTLGNPPKESERYIDYGGWHFFIKILNINTDDQKVDVYKLDDRIDEDLYHYRLIMNEPTGLYSFKTQTNVISRGSGKSYVDLNGDGTISLPEEGSTQLADRVSTAANRVELMLEVVDPKYTGKGSVVFIADADLFDNDLYSLDHMSIDHGSVSHEILKESDVISSPQDESDQDDLADRTPDGIPDYDNSIFLEDLIFYLFYDKLLPGEEVELLFLIDDSREPSVTDKIKYHDAPKAMGFELKDTDHDGLSDIEENYIYGTNGTDPDTDGDGMLDGWEALYCIKDFESGRNMVDPNVPDDEMDPDDDGWTNMEEYWNDTSPIDPGSHP